MSLGKIGYISLGVIVFVATISIFVGGLSFLAENQDTLRDGIKIVLK